MTDNPHGSEQFIPQSRWNFDTRPSSKKQLQSLNPKLKRKEERKIERDARRERAKKIRRQQLENKLDRGELS